MFVEYHRLPLCREEMSTIQRQLTVILETVSSRTLILGSLQVSLIRGEQYHVNIGFSLAFKVTGLIASFT